MTKLESYTFHKNAALRAYSFQRSTSPRYSKMIAEGARRQKLHTAKAKLLWAEIQAAKGNQS